MEMKKKRFRFTIAFLLTLVLIFTMMPTTVLAAGDIQVKLTVKNDTFTSPLLNDNGILKTPKWTGTILENYTLTIGENESLADAMLSCGAIDILDYGTPGSSYFFGFNGLDGGLGLDHEMWGYTYDTTGWQFTIDGVSPDVGPSGCINTTTAIQYVQHALTDNANVVYSYAVDGADTENPYRSAAPTGLNAKATAYNAIVLSWNNTDRAQGYVVYRAGSFNGIYTKIGTSASNSYTDKTAKPGKPYYYKVAAARSVNLQNIGDFSNLVSATTTLGKPVIKVTKKSKTSTKITWKKVDGATQYQVYRATKKNGKYSKIKTVSAKKLSFTNKNLKKGKKYFYKVRAVTKVDGKNVYSAFSAKKYKKI